MARGPAATLEDGFARQLARARSEGVTAGNDPFLFDPPGPLRGALLLVHGFSASPWELRDFGAALAKDGFLALGVRLPGHGTSSEDLAGRRLEEWQQAVAEGYQLLAAHGQPVYGIGVSTGSLLLLDLAARRPLAGLVLLSPFLRLQHRLAPLAGLLRFIQPYQEVDLPENLSRHYYRRRPLAGIEQLNRLIRRVAGLLKQITTPALVISGQGDQTVDIASAKRLFQRLASRKREYHLLGPEAPHVLSSPENPLRSEVLRLTRHFLLELAGAAGD